VLLLLDPSERALSVLREKISAARVYMKAANFSACLFVYKRSAFPFAAFSALSGKKVCSDRLIYPRGAFKRKVED
jgi:hypothetical protein